MNALNRLTGYLSARILAGITALENEQGSEVAEAAGVALLSAVVVGAILGLRGSFSSAVQAAFHQLIGKLH